MWCVYAVVRDTQSSFHSTTLAVNTDEIAFVSKKGRRTLCLATENAVVKVSNYCLLLEKTLTVTRSANPQILTGNTRMP